MKSLQRQQRRRRTTNKPHDPSAQERLEEWMERARFPTFNTIGQPCNISKIFNLIRHTGRKQESWKEIHLDIAMENRVKEDNPIVSCMHQMMYELSYIQVNFCMVLRNFSNLIGGKFLQQTSQNNGKRNDLINSLNKPLINILS